MEIYQDIYSKGKIIKSGVRECEDRYECIKKELSNYSRKFTVLDIGANFGYFSIRAAEDFDCTSFMIQQAPESEVLMDLCSSNSSLNLNLINKPISAEEIIELSKCEHFDVILLLNVLHHLGPKWEQILESCLSMCDTLIVETPPKGDANACGKLHIPNIYDCILNKEHKLLGRFSRHTDPNLKSVMVEIKNNKVKCLEKSYINMPQEQKSRMAKTEIHSNYSSKKIIKNEKSLDWKNGMNLNNFLKLNGCWPTKQDIISKISNKNISTDYKWDDTHGDITPWNFIINSNELYLIDDDGFNKNLGYELDNQGISFTIDKIKN